MKCAFDGLISRLDIAKERIFELGDRQVNRNILIRRAEKKIMKTNRKPECPITVEQFQKV